jgi:hypothetical protein
MVQMYSVRTKEQMMELFQRILYSTPTEFIRWDDIDIDLGDEAIVDGDPDKQWDGTGRISLMEEGFIRIVIPLDRKASVYEYHADQMDKDIESAEQQVENMKKLQRYYREVAVQNRKVET